MLSTFKTPKSLHIKLKTLYKNPLLLNVSKNFSKVHNSLFKTYNFLKRSTFENTIGNSEHEIKILFNENDIEADSILNSQPFKFLKIFTKILFFFSTSLSLYYIHNNVYQNNQFNHYFSFVPYLQIFPLLDLSCNSIFIIFPLILYPEVSLLIYIYIYYNLTKKFEILNLGTFLLSFSKFGRLSILLSLPIIGYQQYQFIPKNQASFLDWISLWTNKLDQSLINSTIVEPKNYIFAFFSFLWLSYPSIRTLPHYLTKFDNN